jgi:signal transduction histidine kinase
MDYDPLQPDRAVAIIGRIDAVSPLLEVLCDMTGMRFAAVVRVSEHTGTLCAVEDRGEVGLKPGDELPPSATTYPGYVSVPIRLGDGYYFGSLCALDREYAVVPESRVLSMFSRFASLIATQLDSQLTRERETIALLDERAAGELREQFIAILGHDLRNPLQAILVSSDRLERKLTDPAQQGVAARIKANARRMSALIDDVLDFARGRLGGGIDLECTDNTDIHTGLMTVVDEILDSEPNCRIIANIDVSRAVRCDLGRIQQVAANLLGNAVTHGLPMSPVRITAKADDMDLIIEVWNAGVPIPPDSIDKIFEPFWRHSTSASRNGLGLGLHICSQIVRAHGGRITVSSSQAGGTSFTARLPLAARVDTLSEFTQQHAVKRRYDGLESQSA